MRNETNEAHNAVIIDQFTKQSIPFSQVPGHHDSLQILIEMGQAKSDDVVLDVACGPGIVSCEFAKHAKTVTGLDVTPAMLAQAAKRQADLGLKNISWTTGDALSLPFPDESFTLVTTRYSFHHLLDTKTALREMIRVCKRGARLIVADVAIPAKKSAAYDRLEKLRDPSHTHALTEDEFTELFASSGLHDCRYTTYGVDIELETQLKASFPKAEDERVIREMVTSDIGLDSFSINARWDNDKVIYTVPVRVYVGTRA
jgi:ubiquinone/menaquinone biosynthesis C-methylase UbiE